MLDCYSASGVARGWVTVKRRERAMVWATVWAQAMSKAGVPASEREKSETMVLEMAVGSAPERALVPVQASEQALALELVVAPIVARAQALDLEPSAKTSLLDFQAVNARVHCSVGI